MDKNKVYWITKTGVEIDIDEMTTNHLRNTLKMIVRAKNSKIEKEFNNYTEKMIKDVDFEYDEWLWK